MSVFTIADLHLSDGSDHAMDVFGSRWCGYTEKIRKNWNAVVEKNDTVIIPGDISWAMSLQNALPDFSFLESLPGRKLIGKGNHDFWWETAAKLGRYFAEHHFDSISLLYNNAVEVEDFIVAGTRGWFVDENQQRTAGEVDYAKIMNRELQRLRLSLDQAVRLRADGSLKKEILVFLHFPPIGGPAEDPIISILSEYGVRRCFYGHIHGLYNLPRTQYRENIAFSLISSDFLNFTPMKIHADRGI